MSKAIGLVVTMILIAGPALAKGPISATITGPGIEAPIELFDQQREPTTWEPVERLMEQTGLSFAHPGVGPAQQQKPPSIELGPGYLLTWEPHGITQTLYLHADGGPWIHTPEQDELGAWAARSTGWWQAPPELIDTLRALGVPPAVSPRPRMPIWLLVISVTAAIAAAPRFVNSRLRPVVSSN